MISEVMQEIGRLKDPMKVDFYTSAKKPRVLRGATIDRLSLVR